MPHAPVLVHVDVSVPYGHPIPHLVECLRGAIRGRLESNTTLTVTGIDITVRDIQNPIGQRGDDAPHT